MKNKNMKNILSFSIALMCSVVLFTSCLKDDDDNNTTEGLSKEQIHNCYLQMAGEHTGKLFFLKKENSSSKSDGEVLLHPYFSLRSTIRPRASASRLNALLW